MARQKFTLYENAVNLCQQMVTYLQYNFISKKVNISNCNYVTCVWHVESNEVNISKPHLVKTWAGFKFFTRVINLLI